MKQLSLVCMAAALLWSASVLAQVQPKQERPRVTAPKEQVKKKPAERLTPVFQDSIIPLEQSDRYKTILKEEETKLRGLFRQNSSGELQFYADTSYCVDCWFRDNTRFKNTPRELEEYIELLRTTQDLYKRARLSPVDRRDLLNRLNQIERYRDQLIKPVGPNGNMQSGCNMMVIASSPVEVTITVTKAAGSKVNLNNVRICMATPSAIARCKCDDCTNNNNTKPPQSCGNSDIVCLKSTGSGKYVLESGKKKTIDQGVYHIIIAEKKGNTEGALYHTRIDLSGKTSFSKTYQVR